MDRLTEWQKVSGLNVPQAVYEEGKEEPFAIYRERFLEPSSPIRIKDAQRYIDESLCGLTGSLLVVGSGHSDHCNTFSSGCPGLKIIASDIVEESKEGLVSSVSFVYLDLLAPLNIDSKFDYVFSTHVLEHFYAESLFSTVWPNIVSLASKAVITVLPYGNAWSDEPSHKCKFYEDDQFASLQDRYKIIFGGKEIVFWKDIK